MCEDKCMSTYTYTFVSFMFSIYVFTSINNDIRQCWKICIYAHVSKIATYHYPFKIGEPTLNVSYSLDVLFCYGPLVLVKKKLGDGQNVSFHLEQCKRVEKHEICQSKGLQNCISRVDIERFLCGE